MNKYFHIKLSLNSSQKENVSLYAYEECNCVGIQHYSIDEAKVDSILGERAFSAGDITEEIIDEVTSASESDKVSVFFGNMKDVDKFKKYIEKENIKIESLTEEDQMDWNEEWKKSYKEIHVSDELKVVPSWDKRKDSQDEVYINPGMGFGTGTHETTYLCLKLMEKIINKLETESFVLDFGCGSGILGIAAVKKKSVICDFVDIDPDALENCVYNLELNHFSKYNKNQRVILRERFSYLNEKYSLVFANILNNVLVSEKNIILENLKVGGSLIVSGLLNHQVDEIINAYSDICDHIETVSKGDWSAILFEKK